MSKPQNQVKTSTPKSESPSSTPEEPETQAVEGAPQEEAPQPTETKEELAVAETPEEPKAPDAVAIRAALGVLLQAYAASPEADPSVADGDALITITASLRMGGNAPVIVEEQRLLRDLLVDPGLVTAPEDFEAALRLMLFPIFKAVQREANRKMSEQLDIRLPGAKGFVPITG